MFSQKKLRIYLITFSLALAAISIGIAVNLQIKNVLEKNLLEQFVEQESLVADQVSSNLETNVASVREKLTLASSIPDINSADEEECQPKLQEVFEIMESKVGNLGRVGPDGYFKCSLNQALVGIKASDLGSYMDDIFADPFHKPVISRAIYPDGANSHLAAIHVPVYDQESSFSGTLGGAIYFNQIQEKLLNDVRFAQNGFVVLFDDNGDILYHPKETLIGQNISSGFALEFFDDNLRNIVLEKVKLEGEGRVTYQAGEKQKLAAFKRAEILPGKYWVVLVTVPIDEAQAALTSVGLDSGFMAFTIVLSVAIFSIAIAALISRLKSLEIEIAKDEFLQLTTHQLQTPITSTKFFLEILLDDEGEGLTKEQVDLIQQAYDSTKHEKLIVDDLLNVARLDSGRLKLNLKNTNLVQTIENAIENVQPTFKRRNQKFNKTIPTELTLSHDESRMNMALENLLSNASKYTQDGGELGLTATEDNKFVTISIFDKGVGIPQADLSNLFKKFSRIPNDLSKSRGGTGLGLYVAKKIVQLHHGNISVTSKENEGTTFIIRLRKK